MTKEGVLTVEEGLILTTQGGQEVMSACRLWALS